MTYWLYFAHFFFFTTLAIRSGRTSLSALYLWGILFGLYESWITKVIWAGYDGNGKMAMGSIGPYGFSEISMVFFFHPVVSFLLPLAISCVVFPELRREFPDLAWMTGRSRKARLFQAWLVLTFAPIMAMNSGGPVNLAVNLAMATGTLLVLWRWARPVFDSRDARRVVVFGRKGFAGLCLYLLILYGVSYVGMNRQGLPSAPVQLLTCAFYGVAIAGLALHRRREPQADGVAREEKELDWRVPAMLCATAMGLCWLGKSPLVYILVALDLMVWTPLGFALAAVALARGIREFFASGAPQQAS